MHRVSHIAGPVAKGDSPVRDIRLGQRDLGEHNRGYLRARLRPEELRRVVEQKSAPSIFRSGSLNMSRSYLTDNLHCLAPSAQIYEQGNPLLRVRRLR